MLLWKVIAIGIIRRTVQTLCTRWFGLGECDLLVLHVYAITRIREHRFKSASDFLCECCRYIPGLIDDGLNFGRDRLLLTPVRKVYPRARVYRRSSVRRFQFKDPCGVLHPEWINSEVWLSNSNTAVRFFFVYNWSLQWAAATVTILKCDLFKFKRHDGTLVRLSHVISSSNSDIYDFYVHICSDTKISE